MGQYWCPSEDLATVTKHDVTFLRYLKRVAEQEQRAQGYAEFHKRCVAGLEVEKDVYMTKEEVLDNMWANGYTESELHAFKISFPEGHLFHYPELAVLFDLDEESCYKYCLRVRAAEHPLVVLKHKKPQNMVRIHDALLQRCCTHV